ncbi:hypothetical protein SLEP1_g7060 [Rubroshorea leprosula]|uniref:Uncharacterized protein n=1 Tax=Rubroshorea leprosula TaxID=152421 RepID=A0AAV5I2Z6_9ROSI|nr:hypothetical protein SLEP1_g7060 [Rubroshorea leprosula]
MLTVTIGADAVISALSLLRSVCKMMCSSFHNRL